MSKIKLQIDWKRMFIGIVLLTGGLLWIFVPVTMLQNSSLVINIVLAITLVLLGTSFIWSATEGLRKRL